MIHSLTDSQCVKLPTLEFVQQATTLYKNHVQYLIRAYLRLDIVAAIYPFEIIEIVPFGIKKQFSHRWPAGSVKLFSACCNDFAACDTLLKKWAAAFLDLSGEIGLPEKPFSEVPPLAPGTPAPSRFALMDLQNG